MLLKKKYILLIIKICVIVAAFALIFHKADTEELLHYLKSANPLSLIAAYVFLTFAQIISAYRTRFYFASSGLNFNNKFAVGLYFVGMFLNNILPGGIGGDAYKIYIIGKLSDFPRLTSLRLLISERASGLLLLILLSVFFAFFSNLGNVMPHVNLFLLLIVIITIPCYFISIQVLLKEKPTTALRASTYSFFVQIAGAFIITAILYGLGKDITNISDTSGYIMLFLISSVIAILPISIGGAGVRELTFMYGGKLLGLDPEIGIAIAMIYFLVSIICSLNGFIFWHKLEKLYKE